MSVLDESRRRHEELTQLEVTRALRAYLRQWFADLRSRVLEDGRPLVVAGANVPHEIFEALDLPCVTDVWYSGLVAARRQSAYYSDTLSRHGYHDGLNRYAALTLGVAIDDGEAEPPWGGLPPASLVVTCPPDRSADALADHWGARYLGLERPVPTRRYPAWWEMGRWSWEELEGSDRIDVMVEQYRVLIDVAEALSGRRLDLDRLREIVDLVNRQEECFIEVRDAICRAPKLPVRLGEAMSQVVGINWHRGTDWALTQARAFADEVRARVEAEQWVCPNERFRLMYLGRGLWQQLDFFAEFEESHGVVFARSNYLSFLCDGYPRYGLRDPIRTLAARYATFNDRLHLPPWAGAWGVWEARTHRLSGAVQIDADPGVRFITRALGEAGLPVLQFPFDAVDSRAWDGTAARKLVTEFIETRLSSGSSE